MTLDARERTRTRHVAALRGRTWPWCERCTTLPSSCGGRTKTSANCGRREPARRARRRKNFVALFQLWHGREPEEGDWPTPRKVRCGEYEWQAPELALLASLVGRLGKAEIAQALTIAIATADR